MEKVFLSALEPELAAQLLAGMAALDPTGMMQERHLVDRFKHRACVAATSEDGRSQAVYVIRVENGVAWVDQAKGHGPLDWVSILAPVIEAQTKGVRSVRFMTSRRGLVRKAQRHGYSVKGWVLAKDVQ